MKAGDRVKLNDKALRLQQTKFKPGDRGTIDFYAISKAVDATMARIRAGERVLVTCKAGVNRSGLVCALVVRELYTDGNGADAVAALRRANPIALANTAFENIALGRKAGL